VGFHRNPLRLGKRPRFQEYRIRYAHLAYIVQRSHAAEETREFNCADLRGNCAGRPGDSHVVLTRDVIAKTPDERQSLDGFDPSLFQLDALIAEA